MQEVFEKIDAIFKKYRKKWLEQPKTEPCKGLECKGKDCMDCILTHLENDINQVAEEYVEKTYKFGNSEQVIKHLDSLHEKILKSKFAEEVTEVEIDALVKAKNLNKFNQELNKPMIEHDGCKGCKYEHETPHSQHCQYCTQNAVDKYTRQTNADRVCNMTDGELADLLVDKMLCDNCFLYDECA